MYWPNKYRALLYWITLLGGLALVTSSCAAVCRADLAATHNATCRISVPDGSRGSGTAFEHDRGAVYRPAALIPAQCLFFDNENCRAPLAKSPRMR